MVKQLVEIDGYKISEIELEIIARKFIPLLNEFYRNEDNVMRFEEWKNKNNSSKKL